MSTPDTTVAAQVDELLRRSSLRVEQQRIHVAELTDYQALRAEGVLTEMLASIDRLTEYRAKLRHREHRHQEHHRNAPLQSRADLQS
jgi:hypothetical protein